MQNPQKQNEFSNELPEERPEKPKKRLLVDMSATLIHQGHIRLLKRARYAADEHNAIVVVGLTSDREIQKAKGYWPELNFLERKEVLESCRYVDEVVETPWLLTEEILEQLNADYLFHGEDNRNPIDKKIKLIVVPRTEGISSSELRIRTAKAIHSQINQRKIMLTPGPGSIPFENVFAVQPLFGRGDSDFAALEERVFYQLRNITRLPCVTRLQGSASLALEIATRSFVAGRVLIINTGYYCRRLINYCQALKQIGRIHQLDIIGRQEFFIAESLTELAIAKQYDWLISVYTETSDAFLNDVPRLAQLKNQVGAKLFLDATASIGLEQEHHLADLIAFSSCKGLGGMTGAAFICYQDDLIEQPETSFYLNIRTHIEKRITGPYHPMVALDRLLPIQNEVRQRVQRSKEAFMEKFGDRAVFQPKRQPLIATLILGHITPTKTEDKEVVFYQPRLNIPDQSIICHLGELHLPSDQPSQIPELLQWKK